ncbi:desmocollin-3-like [Scyliorhinus torazame]|uniref:desmocollin-3-like n=1 Tax=Scyliorhinus torazame TaxID=75743 RepID=UPI003B5C4752
MAAQRVAFLASLLLMLPRFGEACVSKSIDVTVPSREIQKDQVISKVDLECCRKGTLQISTNDPDFAVKLDGSLYAKHVLHIDRQRSFDIELQDSVTSMQCTIHVRLVFQLNPLLLRQRHGRVRRAVFLRRQKRRWRPLPFSITENDGGPFPKFIQTINSEYQQNYTMVYHLTGGGVDTSPKNIFKMDPKTGKIYLLQPVDREEYPVFHMTVMAITIEGYSLEDPLPLTVKVSDLNDNAPKFTKTEFSANVVEGSAVGTIFLKLNATDRDEPNTPRTSLRYKILLQQPDSKYGRLFSVDEITGEIKTKSDKLDREEWDTYTLTVEVRDMEGKSDGLFSKTTVVVHVTDANDNPPTFKVTQYTITVNESVSEIMILRIPVVDKDLANTNASRAVFTITKGNDDGNFKIVTDSETNDGLLYVVKPLDAEATSQIPLEIAVGNEVPLTGSSATRQTASVIVKVLDIDEGPEFVPAVKQLWTNENVAKGKLLGSYTARDPESKSSDGIRYRELIDPADWVTIDAKTGAIKTTAVLDRESEFVKHNKYNVTVLAIQDGVPPRIGTGTVVINLNDVNDNVPIIINDHLYICENGNQQFVNVSAEDLDATPNSAPFTFLLSDSPPEIKKNWLISEKMGSYAFVRPVGTLPVGYYEVPIMIQDQQHRGKEQILKIMICNCPNNENCAGKLASGSAVLGGMGILVMLLAALLLLCLLLAAVALYCGGDEKKKPALYPETAYHQSLIVSNEEGGGQQDKNLDALGIPLTLKDNMVTSQYYDNQETRMGQGPFSTFSHTDGMKGTSSGRIVSGNELMNINERDVYRETNVTTQYSQADMGSANLTTFESNTLSRRNSHNLMDVLRSRVEQVYEEEEQQELGMPVDYHQDYRIEGAESVNGSVGCYSDARENMGLEHLNSFEPKFGTLVSMNR